MVADSEQTEHWIINEQILNPTHGIVDLKRGNGRKLSIMPFESSTLHYTEQCYTLSIHSALLLTCSPNKETHHFWVPCNRYLILGYSSRNISHVLQGSQPLVLHEYMMYLHTNVLVGMHVGYKCTSGQVPVEVSHSSSMLSSVSFHIIDSGRATH